MDRIFVVLVTGALLITTSGAARADVITLADGSRLIGNVQRLGDGKLLLETKFAGTLEIDAAQVVSIDTETPVNVGMDTGDRLVGRIEWQPEIERAVVATEWGGVPVNLERIDAIWLPDGKSPEVLAMEEQIAQVRAEAEAARAKWIFTAEAGLLYKDGNSEILNVRGKIELVRKSAKDLMRMYLSAEYAEEDKDRTTHEIMGGGYYEYLFTERFFVYGRLDLEYDEFENIDLRLSTAAGPGYYWIKKQEHELKTRAGIGYLHETYNDGRTVDTAQAELAVDWRIDIAPWLRFTESASYYPTFESIDDYRLVSDSALVIPLGDSDVWKLKFGALYEYKSQPDAGRERLDQTYYANILAEIK